MKPSDDSYHRTVPPFHNIISNGLDLLEKQLEIPYNESAEGQMEKQQEEKKTETFTYYTPEETRKYLEERRLLHLIKPKEDVEPKKDDET